MNMAYLSSSDWTVRVHLNNHCYFSHVEFSSHGNASVCPVSGLHPADFKDRWQLSFLALCLYFVRPFDKSIPWLKKGKSQKLPVMTDERLNKKKISKTISSLTPVSGRNWCWLKISHGASLFIYIISAIEGSRDQWIPQVSSHFSPILSPLDFLKTKYLYLLYICFVLVSLPVLLSFSKSEKN